MQNVLNALAASALLVATVAAWRLGFAHSDWAGLALVPIFVVLVIGTWDLWLSVWRAKAAIVIQQGSPIGIYLTGKIGSALRALGFATVSVVFIGWIGVGAIDVASGLILASFVLSAALYSASQGFLLRHIRRPFGDAWAAVMATWCSAVPMIALVVWQIWSNRTIDSDLIGVDLQTAIELGLRQFPERIGYLGTLVSWLFAYDSVRLWLVLSFPGQPLVGLIYCLDSALATLIACRAGAIMAYFLQTRVFANRRQE